MVLVNTLKALKFRICPQKFDYGDPVADTEKFSSILVFEEGYNLTTFSIYCGNDIT